MGIDANSIVGNAAGLGQRRPFEAQRSRQTVQAAFRDLNKLGHRAIYSAAKSEPRRFKVIQASPQQGRIRRKRRCRFTGDTVPILESADTASSFCDYARKLVPQDHRIICSPGLRASVHMNVTSANAHSLNREQSVLLANVGNG